MSQSPTDGQAALERVEQQPSPMILIQQTLAQGGDPEKMALVIKALVDLQQSQERFAWEREARQAKIDFDDAINRCQKAVGLIAPNQGRKSNRNAVKDDIFWLDYKKLDGVLRPFYTSEGFAISYSESDQVRPGYVGMKAIVSRGGIEKEYFKWLTLDPSFDKMPKADAEAAAASRVKRYLLMQIFNISVGIDAEEKRGIPEDGPSMDEGMVLDFLSNIEASSTLDEVRENYGEALKAAGVPLEIISKLMKGEHVDVIGASTYKKEAKAFVDAKNKQLGVLKRGGKR